MQIDMIEKARARRRIALAHTSPRRVRNDGFSVVSTFSRLSPTELTDALHLRRTCAPENIFAA